MITEIRTKIKVLSQLLVIRYLSFPQTKMIFCDLVTETEIKIGV